MSSQKFKVLSGDLKKRLLYLITLKYKYIISTIDHVCEVYKILLENQLEYFKFTMYS